MGLFIIISPKYVFCSISTTIYQINLSYFYLLLIFQLLFLIALVDGACSQRRPCDLLLRRLRAGSPDKLLISVFQRDGAAHRPEELLLLVQAVGGFGGRTRARPSVVRKLGHHGNRLFHCPHKLSQAGRRCTCGVTLRLLLPVQEWWTHLWLNEGFASWIEYLCVDHCFPEYDIWTQFVSADYTRALDLDALDSSHPIEVRRAEMLRGVSFGL